MPPDPPDVLAPTPARSAKRASLRYDVAPQRCVDILRSRCKGTKKNVCTKFLCIHLTLFCTYCLPGRSQLLQDASKFFGVNISAGFAVELVVHNNFTAINLQKLSHKLQQRGALLISSRVSWSPISVEPSFVSDADGVSVVHVTMRCGLAQCLRPDHATVTLNEIVERGRTIRTLVLKCCQ